MTMVHHAMHGRGEVIASETSRGRTHYKVAFGPGTEVWMDETEVNLRTASGEGEDLFSFAPQMEAYRHQSMGYPEHAMHDGGGHQGYYGDVLGSSSRDRSGDAWAGSRDRGWDEHGKQDLDWHPSDAYEFENRGPEDIYADDPFEGSRMQEIHQNAPHSFGRDVGEASADAHHLGSWEVEAFGSSAFAHEPPGPIIDYEDPPVYPYDPTPQFPVDMFRHEQTISPDHEIDLKKRTSPSHALTLNDADELTYPGPNPDLFAKDAASHWSDPLEDNSPERQEYGHPDMDWDESENGPKPDPIRQRHRHEDIWTPGEIQDLKKRQGLGSREFSAAVYIDAADHFNDPVQRFRDNPVGEIIRQGGIDISAGLDPFIGMDMDLVQSDPTPTFKTAAWRDVAAKAKRLRREGAVHVEDIGHDRIYASVDGDTGTYQTMIAKGGDYGQVGQGISSWHCSCEWGKWAFKRQMTYVGRLCSHAYAAYMEMQSQHIKSNPDHPFQKRRRSFAHRTAAEDDGSEHGDGVSAFKSWCDAENEGHIDIDAADRFLSTADDPLDKDNAQKIYDYVLENVSERPERDYDQDDYCLNNDEHYKTSEVLRMQPNKLTPDLVVVPGHEGDDAHYFTDLGDDRETTGPEQIMSAKGDNPKQHHPAFAWHTDDTDDFPDNGIVHFSSLTFTADEDLLNKLRNLSDKPQYEEFGDMAERNEQISEVVKELRDRGYDADQFVAAMHTALRRYADDEQDKDQGVPYSPATGGSAPSNSVVTMGNPGATAGGPATPPPAAGAAPPGFTGTPYSPATGGPKAEMPGGSPLNPGGVYNSPGGAGGGSAPAAAPAKGAADPYTTMYPASGGNAPAGAGGEGGPKVQGPGLGNNAGEAKPAGGDYTVQSGDTLSGISQKPGMGGDLSALEKANASPMSSGTNIGQNPDLIHPGDVIKGTGGGGSAGGAEGPAPTPGQTSGLGPTGIPMKDPAGALAAGGANPTPSAGGGKPSAPAASGLVGPAASGPAALPAPSSSLMTMANVAERFALRYFTADDGLDSSDDDQNKPRAQMPSAPAPQGAGSSYKPTAPSTPGAASSGSAASSPGPTETPGKGGTPPGPSGSWIQGPHGPIDTSGHGGDNAEKQMENQGGGGTSGPATGGGSGGQGPLSTNPLGGGSGGGGMDLGSMLGEVGQGIGSAIPGIGGLIGDIAPAIGGFLKHLNTEERFASQYFDAAGSFMGDGGGDWADYPFAGSGPVRQDWSTSSEDYIDAHEKGNRDEQWHIDQDGDITKYADPPRQKPKQSSARRVRRHADSVGSGSAGYGSGASASMGGGGFVGTPTESGAGGADLPNSGMEFHQGNYGNAPGAPGQSTASREFWSDAFDPGETGYFNPRNRPYQEDDSDQYGPHPHHKGKPGGNPAEDAGEEGGGGEAAAAGEGGAGLGELAELAPLALAASRQGGFGEEDDGSDIVRRFQASGAGGLMERGSNNLSGGGGRYDDFAGAAQSFLKTAGRTYSLAEQRALEDEEHHLGARNLDGLDLAGTHYET